MPRKFLAIAALAFSLAAVSAQDPTRPAVATEPVALKKGDKIVFLGDSITAAGILPRGYVSVIKRELRRNHKELDIDTVGAGISGNKVPDLQARLEKDVLAKKPTIVVIYIGINDVWHGERDPSRGTPKDKFEAGLKEIIGKIQAAGARVVLCTPTVIGEKKPGTNSLDKLLDEYAEISLKVAKDTKSTPCDLRKAFQDYLSKNNPKDAEKGVLTLDRVHLNPDGNKLVAETILKTIDK